MPFTELNPTGHIGQDHLSCLRVVQYCSVNVLILENADNDLNTSSGNQPTSIYNQCEFQFERKGLD